MSDSQLPQVPDPQLPGGGGFWAKIVELVLSVKHEYGMAGVLLGIATLILLYCFRFAEGVWRGALIAATIFIVVVLIGLTVAVVGTVLRGLWSQGRNTSFNAGIIRVGDRIRIRADSRGDVVNEDGALRWAPGMNTYRGREAIVVEKLTCPDCFTLDIDGRQFKWSEKWLEKL